MKKILCLILTILFSFTLFACNSKDDIEAPVLTNVYQDVYGSVYIKYNELTNTYDPQVTFDGETFYTVMTNGDKLSGKVLTYDKGSFYYGGIIDEENKSEYRVGDTIFLSILETETKETNKSPLSEPTSYKLREPQETPIFTLSNELSGNNQEKTSPVRPLDNELVSYGIVSNSVNYFFAKKTITNITETEDPVNKYRYQVDIGFDTTYFSNFEFCVLNPSEYPQGIYTVMDLNFDANSLDWKSASGVNLLESENSFHKVTNPMEKYVMYVAYRLKATDSKIESKVNVVTVDQCTMSYYLSQDTSSTAYSKAEFTNMINSYELKLKDNSKIDLIELSSLIELNVMTNYSSGSFKYNGTTISFTNNKTEINSLDIGETYEMQVKYLDKVLYTVNVKISEYITPGPVAPTM